MKKKSEVADFIANQIQAIGKSQIKISEEAGFDKPNIITMMKQGKTKVPLEKIPALARALEVEPFILVRMCFKEYLPEVGKILDETILMSRSKFEACYAI